MRGVHDLKYHLYPMAPPACKIGGVINNVRFNPNIHPPKIGGADRDRTDDLLNANQALFQLSYGPT